MASKYDAIARHLGQQHGPDCPSVSGRSSPTLSGRVWDEAIVSFFIRCCAEYGEPT
jgi:hypothetical protein